ncbi:MAG: VOC family protein [Candidatus Methanoplasma sp.]|jgi:catechol 2,3-dioxygenase-like lactoylglutathione lyase family enzyme|nr:VOC family protein [Candidatus Methanoplasma sp.]
MSWDDFRAHFWIDYNLCICPTKRESSICITKKGENDMNRISIIALGVHDMKRSVKFYRNLGFKSEETSDEPKVIFFDTVTGTRLELYPIQGLAEDINAANPPKIVEGFAGITLAHNVESEEKVRDTIELARKAGATVAKEPQSVFWGGYHAYFADPDGYYWEVAYNPYLKEV